MQFYQIKFSQILYLLKSLSLDLELRYCNKTNFYLNIAIRPVIEFSNGGTIMVLVCTIMI